MIRAPEQCPCPVREVGPSMTSACPGQFLLFMSILESYINGRCDLADPCNRVTDRQTLLDSYDFVVVGGGTAGSAMASRLSENPQWKVLLIEAGGDEPTQSSVPAWVTAYWGREDTDWNYYTQPQKKACLADGGNCSWHRGKMLGGCSTINGMMYMRGHAADYDGWAVNGATGWSWFDVLPYFLKSEDNKEIGSTVSSQHHNTGGPMPVQRFRYAPRFAHDVVAAAVELGFPPTSDLNGDNITGFTIAQTFNDKGSRYSTARGYLRPASARENLHVLLNAHVSRVLIDPTTKKVTGVEYIKNGETKNIAVAKEAVLSAGTLNSPQILMLSGIGPKETLEYFNIPVIKELPGVGQNLRNHYGVQLDFILTKEPNVPELNWETAMEYLLNREGPLSGTGLSQLTGIVNTQYAPAGGRHPDVQFFFSGYSALCANGELVDSSKPEDIKSRRSVSISAVALQPRSYGYLTLQSADPRQPPYMQPNYFDQEHDLDVLVEAARIAYRLANTTILRDKYGMTPSETHGSECPGGGANPTAEFFRCLSMYYTAPENHQVGTCKMGAADDPMAVVDPQLQVYGIEGLRVVDASIMPTVPTSNTAAPTLMVAERGAEFIITRHQLLKNRFGSFESYGASAGTGDRRGVAQHKIQEQKWDSRRKPWDKNTHQLGPAHWDDNYIYWLAKNNANRPAAAAGH